MSLLKLEKTISSTYWQNNLHKGKSTSKQSNIISFCHKCVGGKNEHSTTRLLSREQAADYCGVAPETFDSYRRQGILPAPLSGTKRWDRRLIDEYLDRRSGISKSSEISPLDTWRATRHDQG